MQGCIPSGVTNVSLTINYTLVIKCISSNKCNLKINVQNSKDLNFATKFLQTPMTIFWFCLICTAP